MAGIWDPRNVSRSDFEEILIQKLVSSSGQTNEVQQREIESLVVKRNLMYDFSSDSYVREHFTAERRSEFPLSKLLDEILTCETWAEMKGQSSVNYLF